MRRWVFAGLFALSLLACGFGLFAAAFLLLMIGPDSLLCILIKAFILGYLAVGIWLGIGVVKRLT